MEDNYGKHFIPTIHVVGPHNSGKTTFMVKLMKALKEQGARVAVLKHISIENFNIDTKGKDSAIYWDSGADAVIIRADKQAVLIEHKSDKDATMGEIYRSLPDNIDILMIEGFKQLVRRSHSGIIAFLNTKDDEKEYVPASKRLLIAKLSIKGVEGTLDPEKDFEKIMELVNKNLERQKQLKDILEKLPGIDCGHCGPPRCIDFAQLILDGTKKIEDCYIIQKRKELEITIKIKGETIELHPFVADIIRKPILAALSTLKGVKIEGNEEVYLEVNSPEE